jgi:hypothetical protein
MWNVKTSAKHVKSLDLNMVVHPGAGTVSVLKPAVGGLVQVVDVRVCKGNNTQVL